MMQFISDNKDWLFSGLGVTIVVAIATYLYRFFKKQEDKPATTTKGDNRIMNVVNIGTGATDNGKSPNKSQVNNPADTKAKVHILFIDDEKFNMIKILKTAGWPNIDYRKDVVNLDDNAVLTANVVFVDINGVGTTLFRNQGLGLAAAIKDKHPEKYVVIYSAESDGNRFDNDLRKVDACLPKNAEPMQFMNLIEEYMQSCGDK